MKCNTTLALFFIHSIASGTTTLSSGDLAFLGHNLDSVDGYAFVILKDIDSNTVINFTDRGWNDGSGFASNAGDGVWAWTSDAPTQAGTIVTIDVENTGISSSVGLASTITAPVFSSIGDQVFAYQGDGSLATLIAGLSSNLSTATANNWDGSATNNQTSALPDTFVNGDHAILLQNSGSESDNWRYNGASNFTGTPDEIRAELHDVTNWTFSNTTSFDLSATTFTAFTVVPEPSMAMLSSIGLLALLRRRRVR